VGLEVLITAGHLWVAMYTDPLDSLERLATFQSLVPRARRLVLTCRVPHIEFAVVTIKLVGPLRTLCSLNGEFDVRVELAALSLRNSGTYYDADFKVSNLRCTAHVLFPLNAFSKLILAVAVVTITDRRVKFQRAANTGPIIPSARPVSHAVIANSECCALLRVTHGSCGCYDWGRRWEIGDGL